MAQFSEWYQGISRSRSDQLGFDNLVNCDVHSEIGYITPQSSLEADNTSNVPNQPVVMCKSPDGVIVAFSTSSTAGCWTRTTAGVWTNVTTGANTVFTCASIKGCRYYNGYIHFASTTNLGKFKVSSAGVISDGYKFSTEFEKKSNYKPMEEVNLTLYIGDGSYVASVNSNSTFQTNALDVPVNYTVTALAAVGVELLIGTVIGNYVNNCKVFSWDTYSDSWTIEDEVPERGINCFIKSDDVVFAQAGTQGQLYYWSGSTMVRFKKVRGVTTTVSPYKWTILNGRCLFAAGTKIFSLHKEDNDLPNILVQEYTTSSGNVNSMEGVGGTLVVSCGSIINKTGTAYATAYIDTPEVIGNVQQTIVYYDSIPTGCSIGIAVKKDGATNFTDVAVKTDAIKKKVYFDGGLKDVNFFQARVTMTPYGTTRPKIRIIEAK